MPPSKARKPSAPASFKTPTPPSRPVPPQLSRIPAKWVTPVLAISSFAIGAIGMWAGMTYIGTRQNMTGPNNKGSLVVQEPLNDSQNQVLNEETTLTGAVLDVAWFPNARQLLREEAKELFLAAGTTSTVEDFDVFYPLLPEDDPNFGYVSAVWDVGSVITAPMKDAEVFLVKLSTYDLGLQERHVFLVRSASSRKLYLANADAFENDYERSIPMNAKFMGFLRTPSFSIVISEPPLEISVHGSSFYRSEDDPWVGNVFRFESPSFREVVTADDGTVLWEDEDPEDQNQANGCLYAFGSDGRRFRYGPRIQGEVDEEAYMNPIKPAVVWTEKYENTDSYLGVVYGGCGAYGCAAIISEEDALAAGGMVVAGTTEGGAKVFVPARPEDHPIVKGMYDMWYVPDAQIKPSMREFLSRIPVPVFFWKDAIGRWIVYRSASVQSMAECGKPVIYLYPESTTDVRVTLPSFINVTVSDPAYPSFGWNVTAHPNGDLVSHADGNTYGSLYWEGTGVGYETPKTGFLVKDGEVESFLSDILPKYGLNQKEAQEFMDFWVPKMQGAPYYRVSFLTDDWSKAAPLYVSPRPKTSIRIFMDWSPLSAPISIQEPRITTPARNGFTLVEWGGILR